MIRLPGPAEEFLAKYGEKGRAILKAILAAYRTRLGGPRLGDFSYKQIKEYLAKQGISYNPSLLLSKLEKEYGLIETTYKSSGQHWWRITDPEAIENALQQYDNPTGTEQEEPYRVRMLRIQFYALEPDRIMETLHRLTQRRRLTPHEQKLLRQIVFEDLPRIVEFLEEAEASYPEELHAEILMAETIVSLAEKLVIPRKQRATHRLEEPLLRGKRQTF